MAVLDATALVIMYFEPIISAVAEAPIQGSLFYSRADRSFRFQPPCPGMSQLLVRTIAIELGGEDGQLLTVSGYSPEESWQLRSLPAFAPMAACLRADMGSHEPLSAGGYEIGPFDSWKVEFDGKSGWLRVQRRVHDRARQTEFAIAEGVGVGLTETGRLASLWLRPSFLD